ncbi:FAD/NAD(P)-binding domain-containing protein [Byssothecium circinans]|uniref:FAD/NAD(P)-binding domain-containing protein n=1 Tax=Byssothecium circinans TaxID=147558 RepID=A0A6A5TM24_9PLEO|nr:FAD/NAD(P)-binding domain-containing protein [Byssothecium circinans]
MASSVIDAVVVGGSIAGLMHGVVLKALGRRVIILESRKPQELKAQAAGLSLGPEAQELLRAYVPSENEFAIDNPATQILSAEGVVLREIPPSISVVTSSWNVVFEKLKTKFEEVGSGADGSVYETGARVADIKDKGDSVVVIYQREGRDATETIQAKLVIAADGFRSIIRTALLPETQPKYAGYLAWRGCVPESMTPDPMKGVLDGKLVMSMLEGSYILSYLNPGLGGSIALGERLLDWCWYDACEEDSAELDEIMTDSFGHRHNHTVPRGALSDKAWERQLKRAEEILPSFLLDIVRSADGPFSFVTAISSFDSSKASFYGGKVLLVGEAFTQFRPHLGLGSNLGAFQALALARMLNGEMDSRKWEDTVTAYAQEIALRSSATGHFGMTGKWPEGYIPPYLRK